MVDDEPRRRTRRRFLVAGAAVAATGVVAGCSGGNDSGSTVDEGVGSDGQSEPSGEPTATASPTPTATPTRASTDSDGDTDAGTAVRSTPTSSATATATPGGSYTASISPVGEVTFESEPEEVFTLLGHHSEMALALGRGEDVNTTYAPGYVDSLVSAFTPRLDGVSVDWSSLTRSWGIGKETVYELDSDVHLADPAQAVTMKGWDESDVAEIAEQVGPWFGNSLSGSREDPPEAYAGNYEYYGLWEIFERVARALGETERYRALAQLRSEILSTVSSSLPPAAERPSVAMVLPSTSDDSMWGYHTNAAGYYAAHTRPFGATDALAEAGVENGAQIDVEALLSADPEVLIVLGGLVDYHDIDEVRAWLEDDPVASQVTAVDEGRVYAQGTRHQGPLVNLFQLEATAKQLYPDAFGAWPDYENGDPYPEVPADERLLDYDRLADVITGESDDV